VLYGAFFIKNNFVVTILFFLTLCRSLHSGSELLALHVLTFYFIFLLRILFFLNLSSKPSTVVHARFLSSIYIMFWRKHQIFCNKPSTVAV
jgi:hypothetical protein